MMTDQELVDRALAVRECAYAPYSQFSVGAVLLGKSGEIYAGTNVENASYGLTICAERSAVFSAIAAGEREFEAVAIVVKGAGSPCGACRQVLSEFHPSLRVILADEHGKIADVLSLADLLPRSFGPHSL